MAKVDPATAYAEHLWATKASTPSPQPETLGSHSAGGNAPPAADAAPMPNPFEALLPVLTGAPRAVGTKIGPLFDLLLRSGKAAEALGARGPKAAASAFMHGETTKQHGEDRTVDRPLAAALWLQGLGVPAPVAQIEAQGITPFYNSLHKKNEPALPTASIERALGAFGADPKTAASITSGIEGMYGGLPHLARGAIDFATDTTLDPTTYIFGGGAGDAAAAKAGEKFVPFARALDAAEHATLPVTEESHPLARALAPLAQRTLRSAGKFVAGAHDFANYKGAEKRALAAAMGVPGLEAHGALRAINAGRKTVGSDLAHTLLHEFSQVTDGLTSDEEGELYKAIHTGTVAELPPKLAERAQAFKGVTDTIAHLQGDEGLQNALGEFGFSGPSERFARFRSAEPRGLQEVDNYRKDYLPIAHNMKPYAEVPTAQAAGITDLDPGLTDSELRFERLLHPKHGASSLEDVLKTPKGAPEQQIKDLDTFDPNLERREAAGRVLPAAQQRQVIESRLRGAARSISAHDAEQAVTKLFGAKAFADIPTAAKEFFRETYTNPEDRSFFQHLGDLAKGAVDIPKIGLFSMPFRHMANIASLAVLADPSVGQTFGTVGKFAKLMLAGLDDDQRAKILGDAVKVGAAGSPSIDREAAGWIGKLTPRDAINYATKHDLIRPGKWSGWLGKVPGVGDLYKLSTHALWAFDDAAKATRFERLREQYVRDGLDATKAAYRAANDVSAELISYDERSPLTRALAYIAPFATFRSKVPFAIARALARHPERILAEGRIAPELVGDLQQAPPNAKGKAQVGKSYLPLAETLRDASDPAEYVRSTLGYPVAMALSGLGEMEHHGSGVTAPALSDYMTYGKKPDWKYLANQTIGSFPGGEQLLARLGQGEWTNQGSLSGAIRGQTGFGETYGPTPTELATGEEAKLYRSAIDAALKAGDAPAAAAYEKALKTLLYYRKVYTP